MTTAFWNSPTWRIRMWAILAAFALLVMETTAVSLWYQAIFQPKMAAWGIIALTLLVIFGASHLLAHIMEHLHWRMAVRWSVFAAWVLVLIFTSLKLLLFTRTPIPLLDLLALPVRFILLLDNNGDNFFHLIFIALLIWRGVALARMPISLNGVQASFQLGLILILLYGMMFAPLHPIEATVGMYIFLFSGLVAMSATRMSSISELRGGRIPRFGLGWMTSILLAGLAVVGLALVIGWLSSGRVLNVIAVILLAVLGVLTALVLFLLSPLLIYLASLIPEMSDLIQQIMNRLANLSITQQVIDFVNRLNRSLERITLFLNAGRGLVLAGILAVLLLGILLALRFRRIQRELIEEEAADSTEAGGTDNPLQKLLHRLLNASPGRRLRNPMQILAAARIRQIYRQLMALSQKMGKTRPPSLTPLEFLPQLEVLFPGENSGLEMITSAYLKVRYGEYPETRQEVTAVEQAWEQVRRKGRKTKTR